MQVVVAAIPEQRLPPGALTPEAGFLVTTYGARVEADFLDRESARLSVSRSRLIAHALSKARLAEEERLAAEGYLFYTQKASEFAQASSGAVAKATEHDARLDHIAF